MTRDEEKEVGTTHYLLCRHQIGRNGWDYYMPCNILKAMPDGERSKIEVFGKKYWKRDPTKRQVRYIYNYRLKKRTP